MPSLVLRSHLVSANAEQLVIVSRREIVAAAEEPIGEKILKTTFPRNRLAHLYPRALTGNCR